MYQHLRIALEHAQERLQYRQEQSNIRRRRRKTIEICSTTVAQDSVTTYDNPKEKGSNDHLEMIQQLSTDPEETSDIDADFDLISLEEDTIELPSGLNSYCEVPFDDQDEPLVLDDLFPPNNNQNSSYLHSHTTIKTHDFCGQLIEIFRDANISNIHCSRFLRVINGVLPQPHNSPTTLKALYNSMQGVPTRSGVNYKLVVYGLTGDCPAIKLATKHVNHQGYWCCWFCYIQGIHIDNKRQYYFQNELVLRSTTEYAHYSEKAERTNKNIFGHLGVSPLATVFNIPLPRCLIIDYMHVSLLRHTRTVIQYLYQKYLKPKQRNELDELFRHQPFPHFCNRKMRPVKEFSATELRNMLLYGLLPLIRSFLPVDLAAHLSLYVTAMRLLHGPRKLGDDTEIVANELMNAYYKDHQLFYTNIQHFVLHLHCHLADQYYLHGSLSNLGVFGQESLLGHFAKSRHGTPMTSRRQVVPRHVFTPTQRTPPPSHYLLVFEDTNSYQIAARSSIKQITGDVVSIMIRNKLVKAKAVCHGSLEDCNTEYVRLTRVSQNETDEHDDVDSENDKLTIDDWPMNDVNVYSKPASSNCLSSTVSSSPILTSIQSPRQISDKGDQNVQIDKAENIRMNSKNSNILEDIDNRVGELSEKFVSTSSKIDQQMQRLSTKIDRFASTVNIKGFWFYNKHAIESYIDKSGEHFPSEYMFGEINLLDVMATDYGDYARQILQIIYTSDELKNSILPPGKPHLARPPLAKDRFKKFLDSSRRHNGQFTPTTQWIIHLNDTMDNLSQGTMNNSSHIHLNGAVYKDTMNNLSQGTMDNPPERHNGR
ncbi:unnamed protein product [Rotaria sp. Silwood2]|nr:unnamed protein product [Rotaria sp. Silwood2]